MMAIDPEKTTVSEIEDVRSKTTVVTNCMICDGELENPVVVVAMDMESSGTAVIPTIIDEDCASTFSAV